MRNCWSVLGISPTADKKEIKKAYAAKSREFHPAEHPAEYEELKKAYQEAIRLSSQPQPQPEQEQRPVLNPIPEKDHGLEEFYDHLETEARSKFFPNAQQW
ncbi:MAG: DnaJ domain-containing protein, partial [Lachnospiraceae bacterium]|nr:DnaJ domain-containing protein [Lachnospiraceae bacterium]